MPGGRRNDPPDDEALGLVVDADAALAGHVHHRDGRFRRIDGPQYDEPDGVVGEQPHADPPGVDVFFHQDIRRGTSFGHEPQGEFLGSHLSEPENGIVPAVVLLQIQAVGFSFQLADGDAGAGFFSFAFTADVEPQAVIAVVLQ